MIAARGEEMENKKAHSDTPGCYEGRQVMPDGQSLLIYLTSLAPAWNAVTFFTSWLSPESFLKH